MRHTTFTTLRRIIYQRSGISLDASKKNLLETRVHKRLLKLGLPTAEKYVELIMSGRHPKELVSLINAISTNLTGVFREGPQLDYIAEALGERLRTDQSELRLWSAACSTGEEAVSMLMVAIEAAAGRRVDIRVLGTDISTDVLQTAKRGVYNANKIAAIPDQDLVHKYFAAVPESQPPSYKLRPRVARQLSWARLNLATPPYPIKGPFDVIACCNVTYYFDDRVKTKLLSQIARLLAPGGHLFLSHSERLSVPETDFELCRPAVYRRK